MGNSSSQKSMTHLTNKDIDHLIQKTYFDEKEIKKWHQHFLKDCPTGYLKKEEFQAIYRQVFPHGDPTLFSGFVFNVFDKDLDGTITFEEFLMALSVTSRGNLDEKLTWAFSLYDIDRDGQISRSEMVKIIQAIHAMVGDRGGMTADQKANQIFDLMDNNKDGYLTVDEFRKAAKSDPWIVHALALDPTHFKR